MCKSSKPLNCKDQKFQTRFKILKFEENNFVELFSFENNK